MSYNLKQIWDDIRREARCGTIADYTEQYAQDLVGYWNRVIFDAWRMNNWDYSIVDISFTLPANTTTPYTLDTTVGSLIILSISGQKGYLRSFSEKQFQQWQRKADASATGQVYGYVKRGLAATGAIKVLFVDAPATNTVIVGEGKAKLSKVSLSDVQADTAVAYFPDHIVEILKEWTAGILMSAINDARGPGYIASAQRKIQSYTASEKTDAADDVTSPSPDLVRFGARQRGSTKVA